MRLALHVATERLPLAEPFRFSGQVVEAADVVVVTLNDGEHEGRGEGSGVYYLGDDVPNMLSALEGAREAIERGPSRLALRDILAPGGARNAVDCALWELEAARSGRPVWALAGLAAPRPLRTTFTLGAASPALMAGAARRDARARALKIKLTGDLDLDVARVAAVRQARPDVWLGADCNQAYEMSGLSALAAALHDQRVSLLEQPLARGREGDLDGFRSPIPLAADESVLSLADVPGAAGRFDVISIKLDKSGGLTEALMMAAKARKLGLGVMVGTMAGTSLATAPAFVLAHVCDFVDLDAPTFLARDRAPSVRYDDGNVWAGPEVWGGGSSAPA